MSKKTWLDPKYLAYVAEVAVALDVLRARPVSYGEYYIERVTFGFDGESMPDLAIVQGEHDALAVEVTIP